MAGVPTVPWAPSVEGFDGGHLPGWIIEMMAVACMEIYRHGPCSPTALATLMDIEVDTARGLMAFLVEFALIVELPVNASGGSA